MVALNDWLHKDSSQYTEQTLFLCSNNGSTNVIYPVIAAAFENKDYTTIKQLIHIKSLPTLFLKIITELTVALEDEIIRHYLNNILEHPSINNEIIHIIVEYLTQKGVSTPNGIMIGNRLFNSSIHMSAFHPETSYETLQLIVNTSAYYAKDILRNPKTDANLLEQLLQSFALPKNAVFQRDLQETLTHPKMTSNVLAKHLANNSVDAAKIYYLSQRNDWKEILLKTLQPTYPEATDQLPVEWLEALLPTKIAA